MTFWQNVWREVAKEMPATPSRARTWGGFFGAVATALVLIVIWFPIRFVYELLKAIDLSEKPDHRAEARELYAEALTLTRDLLRIPTEAGHLFRDHSGHHSDLKPATVPK